MPHSDHDFTIGRLAARCGCSTDTIRFYESKKLLSAPPRTQGGHRLYAEEHIKRLSFIQSAKSLGFSLAEIQVLIALEQTKETPCQSVSRLAQLHYAIVKEKIAELTRIGEHLEGLIQQCEDGKPDRCAILDNLNKPSPQSA